MARLLNGSSSFREVFMNFLMQLSPHSSDCHHMQHDYLTLQDMFASQCLIQHKTRLKTPNTEPLQLIIR